MVSNTREQLLSLKDAAKFIGCSIQTLRKWASTGCEGRVLETVKYGRLVRTSYDALERFQRPHSAQQSHQTQADRSEFLRVQRQLAQRHN